MSNELLAQALDRMDRARSILTNGAPTPLCNWGTLDTTDLRIALAAHEALAAVPVEPVAFVHWPLNGPPKLVWYSNKALESAILKTYEGHQPDLLLYAHPAPQPQRCPYCDDTGDVHSADGEWRGVCTCPAGAAPQPQQAGVALPLTCSRSNRSDCALFDTSANRPSREWYAAKIMETEGLDDALPCGALTTTPPQPTAPAPQVQIRADILDYQLGYALMLIRQIDVVKTRGNCHEKGKDCAISAIHDALESLKPAVYATTSQAPQAQAVADVVGVVSFALRDVAAERERQIGVEGWTPEHDDNHPDGSLALAAACYAAADNDPRADAPPCWPWDPEWWKPGPERRNLVKSGALILAEIERLDRASAAQKEPT